MEGHGEGIVAVVHSLQDAGLAVTLMSKRYGSPEKQLVNNNDTKNHSVPQITSSVETNTHSYFDAPKHHAGVQICDDRYASSYQLAHCRVRPTSPPVSLSEFPPQRPQPCPTQGNFKIGGYGSGETTTGPINHTKYSYNSIKWSERDPLFNRVSCQTDSFAHSLRSYPSFLPNRSISADLIERLIKHTQAKNSSKHSKFSKSVRCIPKDKETDEQTDKHSEKVSKNIQTYTRSQPHGDENVSKNNGLKKDRSLRRSVSGVIRNKKSKDSYITATYDYLQSKSGLYRRKFDRRVDVRYLDNLTKYIKDALQQMYEDKPVMCPKIQSRYEHHRRNYHVDQLNNESNEAADQAAAPDSRRLPSTSAGPRFGKCKENCPRDRHICEDCQKPVACSCISKSQAEVLTKSSSSQMDFKFCKCKIEKIVGEPAKPEVNHKKDKNILGICEKSEDLDDQAYDKKLNDEVVSWLKDLPVFATDTFENAIERERLCKELVDVIKTLPLNENYDKIVLDEIRKCSDKLPIWLPESKSDQEWFKNHMAEKLLKRIKKLPKELDKFADIIQRWVNDLTFTKDIDKGKVSEDLINRLKPIDLKRPENNFEYAKKIRENIIGALDCLPVETKGEKDAALNHLSDRLIDKLVILPKAIIKSEDALGNSALKPNALSVRDIIGIIHEWLDEEPELADKITSLNYYQDVEYLSNLLYDSQLQDDVNVTQNMKTAVQDFLKNTTDIIDSNIIDKLTNKLLNKLKINKVIQELKSPEEEIYKVLYTWMKNLPETSQMDTEKLEEIIRELAKNIYAITSLEGKQVNIPEWLKQNFQIIENSKDNEKEKHRVRNLVLNEVDGFLEEAIVDLPLEVKNELKSMLADVLIKNVVDILVYEVERNLLHDETDKIINKLFENVKRIFSSDAVEVKPGGKLSSGTLKILQEEVDNLLDNYKSFIKNSHILKANLMNILVEGTLQEKEEIEIKKNINELLCTDGMPENEAEEIAKKLVNKIEEITLNLNVQDSSGIHREKLSKGSPSKLTDSVEYQKKHYFVPNERNILDRIKRETSSIQTRYKTSGETDVLINRRPTLKGLTASQYKNKPNKINGVNRAKDISDPSGKKSPKQFEDSVSGELREQLNKYNIDDIINTNTQKNIQNGIKTGIHNVLCEVKTDICDREDLETNLLDILLNRDLNEQINEIKDDVYNLLRESNIPNEVARNITNKLISKANAIFETIANKGPSVDYEQEVISYADNILNTRLDSKTVRELKNKLKDDIHKIIDNVDFKIDNCEHLKTNLFSTLLNQIVGEDADEIGDDVYNLLRQSNVPEQQARDITTKLLVKVTVLSEAVAEELSRVSSKRSDYRINSSTFTEDNYNNRLDFKTVREIKRILQINIHSILENVKNKIVNRQDLETNLLNKLLNQVVDEDDLVRDDVYNLLLESNIPEGQAKSITKKLLSEAIYLAEGTTGDTEKPKKNCALKLRPMKADFSAINSDELKESVLGDISDIIDRAPLPLSANTKEVLKTKICDAITIGMRPPYNNQEVKNKVIDILAKETIKLQHKDKKRKGSQLTGSTENKKQKILQEMDIVLAESTRIPKYKRKYLKNNLTNVIKDNSLNSDTVRNKIKDVLMGETNLHPGVINDVSSDIVKRVTIIKDLGISNNRKDKRYVYNIEIDGKKRMENSKYYENTLTDSKNHLPRKKAEGRVPSNDGSVFRTKSKLKIDTLQLNKCIQNYIDQNIANIYKEIPKYKIDQVKHELGNLSSGKIHALLQHDSDVKNNMLNIIKNQLELHENDANELIDDLVNDIQSKIAENNNNLATSTQVRDVKGYLKGEILNVLDKFNVKFTKESGILSGSYPPLIRGSCGATGPFSSTPKNGVLPNIINNASLSTIFDEDDKLSAAAENTLKRNQYNRVLQIVNDWVTELPINLNTDIDFRETMAYDLATDIIERQKYLQVNPNIKVTEKEELECLKYQVFRCLNNLIYIGDLTPFIPKIEELGDRLKEVFPLLSKSSKSSNDADACIDKLEDWVESIPIAFNNREKKEQFENLKPEFYGMLKKLGPQANAQVIKNKIKEFLRKCPLDPSKKVDIDGKIDELTRIVQTLDNSKMMASFEPKTGSTKHSNELYECIENWCENLPFDESSIDQENIKNTKLSLANKILQKICQLNINPETLNDDFLYEDMLRDEIDNLLNDVRNYIPVNEDELSELADLLVKKLTEAKRKTQNELAGQIYKQQLRDAISKTLPAGLDLTDEDQTSLEVLKDGVADAFININYSFHNEELKNKFKKKIADEVTKFCNNYLQRHPGPPICSNKLKHDIDAALRNVSVPNDESLRSEIELIRIKELIADWAKFLPLAEHTTTGQFTLYKMISILAKYLHDLETTKENDAVACSEEMRKEIKKWLRKLPLIGGTDSVDLYATDLLDRLKNTEDTRRFDASMRFPTSTSDIFPRLCQYEIRERPKPQSRPCSDTWTPGIQYPSSSLTREDRDHLDIIRERVQEAKCKLKRPSRDASIGACIDSSSQTIIRPFGMMNSVPSVCPWTQESSYRSAAKQLRESPSCHIPCGTPRSEKSVCPGMYTPGQAQQDTSRRFNRSPRLGSFSPCSGSYTEIQPQVIVKEYFWDSGGNSNEQMHNQPCEYTCQGSQGTRSPCSQLSPRHRGPFSPTTQKASMPQSPQISSLEQESRRPRPECSSRCYRERITRLGSLNDMRGLKKPESFDWSTVKFPEDDFWGPCSRPLILSDDDFGPLSREREKKDESVRCRCRERVFSKYSPRKRNKCSGGSSHSCMHDPSKQCSRCSALRCPHPSYLYFRQ